jgi:hypothetical protein
MRLIVLDGAPDLFELFGISRAIVRLRHSYSIKSSASDFWTSAGISALAR